MGELDIRLGEIPVEKLSGMTIHIDDKALYIHGIPEEIFDKLTKVENAEVNTRISVSQWVELKGRSIVFFKSP